MEENDISIENCRGQSYDNVTNISGMYKGVQAIIRERCSSAYYVLWTGHLLKLVRKCATEGCPAAYGFFIIFKVCMPGLLHLPIDGRYTENI